MGTKKRGQEDRSRHPERPRRTQGGRTGAHEDPNRGKKPRSEDQIDESLEETFPASDPPSQGRFD